MSGQEIKTELRKKGFYEVVVKRLLDIVCALLTLLLFSWLYLLLAILVRIKVGRPVLFRQPRSGMTDSKTGKERIFDILKYRTMSYEQDAEERFLPDHARLIRFGERLRRTSLDEIPEVINILKGDMSFVGPRPFLVRDMVFMSEEQRRRHTARPGLTGLAQVMGRNSISWEEKMEWDLRYIEKVSFLNDLRIIFQTIRILFRRGEHFDETDLADDYGDALLKEGKVTKEQYDALQAEALRILDERK